MMKSISKERVTGFSMVELIVAIVLIGIISTVIAARFTSATAFNPGAAQDAIIAVARAAQQASLGRNSVSFEIDVSGADWVFSAVAAGMPIRVMTVSAANVELETGSAASSANTCANDFDTAVANDFEMNFDGRGNLVDFTNNASTELVGPTFNGVRICINDTVSQSVCVSPAGFAYPGDCDD